MKKTQSYFMYFLFGAIFGLFVTCAVPQTFADYVGRGFSNMYIYGSIGYAICAIKNKEYKKIWNVILFIVIGFLIQYLIFR